MDLGLLDFRISILGALGLLAACGPLIDPIDGSGDGSSEGSSGGSSSVTLTATAPGDSDTTTAPPSAPCEGSTPILQSNIEGSLPTGWELCDDGRIHRAAVVACDDPLPPGPACALEGPQSCLVDADCTAAAMGRCIQQPDLFGEMDYCGCSYGCATDDDCSADQVCACGGSAPGYPSRSRCVASTCIEDEACGSNELCGLGSGYDGCGTTYAAACTTPGDQCVRDDDCEGDEDCFPAADGGWACENFCCCGRPLLVDGRPITAPVVARRDWSVGDASVGCGALPAVLRSRIADHFIQAAQLEHASIASFARFTLELMALGAPPALLAAAQRAGLDEIDHAQRCFALAAVYAGRPLGPGALAIAGASPATTLEAVAAALIDEACVGETLAAVEALAASRHATEPAVREALAVIAADEQRHAELGWKTLRWALSLADGPMRMRLLARLDAAIDTAARERPVAMVDHDRDWLRAHGVLDPADRRAAHSEALATVLRPCAAALATSEPASASRRRRRRRRERYSSPSSSAPPPSFRSASVTKGSPAA